MSQGTVRWFNEEKGYGFVSLDEGGEDLFVHYTGIVGRGFRALEKRATGPPTRLPGARMRAEIVSKT